MGTEHSSPYGGEQSTSKTGRPECRPFGDPATARVFVIGHDPRLQISDAQAETVFFLDYLEPARPTSGPEAAKYGLASATVKYMEHLTGGTVPLAEMYFTNLCNEFLPHPRKRGTVLIPDEVAERGIAEIEKALRQGKPHVIIPMSLQVFYHLARAGFVAMGDDLHAAFLQKATPKRKYAEGGAYMETGRAPFLDVCGRRFLHGDIPVVPVLHVKSWSSRRHGEAYESAMQNAGASIQRFLAP